MIIKIIKVKGKIYKVIIIYVLIALFLVIILIYPSLSGIKENSDTIILNKSRAMFVEAEVSELVNFKSKYESYKPNLEKVDKLFFDPKNPINFVKFLEKISFDSGIISDINLISSQKRGDNEFLITIFQVSIKGNVSNVLEFIEKLERGAYLTEIKKVGIKKVSEDNGKIKEDNDFNKVEASFLIEVFTE